jgi:hypothetical protein
MSVKMLPACNAPFLSLSLCLLLGAGCQSKGQTRNVDPEPHRRRIEVKQIIGQQAIGVLSDTLTHTSPHTRYVHLHRARTSHGEDAAAAIKNTAAARRKETAAS